jgi:hypothetical protein
MTTTRILTELSRRAVDDVAYKFSERTVLRQEGAAGRTWMRLTRR